MRRTSHTIRPVRPREGFTFRSRYNPSELRSALLIALLNSPSACHPLSYRRYHDTASLLSTLQFPSTSSSPIPPIRSIPAALPPPENAIPHPPSSTNTRPYHHLPPSGNSFTFNGPHHPCCTVVPHRSLQKPAYPPTPSKKNSLLVLPRTRALAMDGLKTAP
ncbi:hypothetical protein BJ508DRAFT_173315 [Ascobolus immersus RN42]|uniref:Uncharacterized protein n=1 Tax=Ascobolus immersus RN42 TaxID=1160509 RepID=A0A3N4HTR1_ASCIM|nr:hypothetical protein BJ508DRAFT_173315 [Ascobolus immersus RN42]